jgi:hypothetical protein
MWIEAKKAIKQAGYENSTMFTTQMAAEVLGLSDAQLHRLGVEPDGVYLSRYSIPSPQYSHQKVLALYNDPRVVRARARRTGKRDWPSIFKRDFPSREAAVTEAAEILCRLMFRTRGASWEVRARVNRHKRDLVRFLYENGYCIAVREDIAEPGGCCLCQQISCRRCEWKSSTRDKAFAFEIAGQHYNWSLPRKDARFAEPDPSGWVEGKHMDEHQVSISKAYALLDWVTGKTN